MGLIVIGVIRDKSKKQIGLRIFDDVSDKYKDVPTQSIIDNMIKGVKIEGLKVEKGVLSGSNGVLDRYPQICGGNVQGIATLIVLEFIMLREKNVGYKVVNYEGKKCNITIEDLNDNYRNIQVANGMLKTALNGRIYISAIRGTHDKMGIYINPTLADTSWEVSDFEKYMRDNNYKYVIRCGDALELDCPEIKYLKIPDGIAIIELKNACNYNVSKIIIPHSLQSFKNSFNSLYRNLKELVFLEGVGIINGNDLNIIEVDKVDLTSIKFPSTLKEIDALYIRSEKITDITLPNGLRKIQNSFHNLIELTTVFIPDTVTTMVNCFNSCLKLKHIEFPAGLEKIERRVALKSEVETVNLSRCTSLKTIGMSAFAGSNIKKLILHEGIEFIGQLALPNDVEVILRKASHKKELIQSTCVTSIVIEDPAVIIEDLAFANLKGLKKVKINSKIMKIGNYAFRECTELESVDMDNNEELIGIGESAFAYCSKLKYIDLKGAEKLSKIGSSAFVRCTGMHKIDLSDVKVPIEIGDYAFDGSALEEIIFPMGSKGVIIGKYAFNCSRVKRAILPEGLEELSAGLFKDCRFLELVVVPRSVKKIHTTSIGSMSRSTTRVAVFRGSEAEKICRKKAIKIEVIDNLEDLTAADKVEIDPSKKNILNIMLQSDPVHSELFKEEYINHADKLYQIYRHLTSEHPEEDVELIKDQFIKLPLNKSHILKEYISKIESSNIDDTSSRFNVLCNYITSAFKLNKYVLYESGLNYIVRKENNWRCIYSSTRGSIISITHKDLLSSALFIIIDDNIVFTAAYKSNTKSSEYNFLENNSILKKAKPTTIVNNLSIGDSFNIANNLNASCEGMSGGVKLPKYIARAMVHNIIKNCIVINTVKFNTLRRAYADGSFAEGARRYLYLLCCRSGYILKVQNETASFLCENNDNNIGELRIFDINIADIKEFNKEVIAKMADKKYDEDYAIKLYESLAVGKNIELESKPGDYDGAGECDIWKLGKKLKNRTIEGQKDLTVDLIKEVTSTPLYKQVKNLSNKYEAHGRGDMLTGDGVEVYEWSIYKKGGSGVETSIIGAAPLQALQIKGEELHYISNKRLRSSINFIKNSYKDYSGTEDLNRVRDVLMTDTELKDRFQIVEGEQACHSTKRLFLAICRYTGSIFLLYRELIGLDKEKKEQIYRTVEVLRFKDLRKALKQRYNDKGEGYNSRAADLNSLMKSLLVGANWREEMGKGQLLKVRESIMDGVKNGQVVPGIEYVEMLNDAAKQRRA